MDRPRDSKGRFVKARSSPKRKRRPSAKRARRSPEKRAKRTWLQALKAWNKNQDEWTIPKKGTKEYREVKALQRA
jgi:hypothetical protein